MLIIAFENVKGNFESTFFKKTHEIITIVEFKKYFYLKSSDKKKFCIWKNQKVLEIWFNKKKSKSFTKNIGY